MMKNLLFLTVSLLLVACGSKNPKTQSTEKWSVKMANAIMERNDSLGFYNGRTRMGWSYDVAMLGMAIDKLGDIDPKYSQYMEAYMNRMVDDNGNIARYDMEKYNIDLINPGKNLLILYDRTGEEKYKTAIETLVNQMENHPKTKSGGFWHKKRYPWQIWLDGLYMGSPFLARYAQDFNEPKWYDEVAHEIMLVYNKTLDPETGLLYHAWDESREQRWSDPETGQSPHFWSRATGWYMMALVDVLDYLPQDHPKRDSIIQILQNTSEALLKVRDEESGVWHQVLDMGGRDSNYLEGSGTAMYTYAFAKGAKKGYLDKKYLDIANEVFDDMVETFIIEDEDGLISMVNICGSCGLGGDPYRDGSYEYYVTERIVKNDCKGVAPFIFAAVELDR